MGDHGMVCGTGGDRIARHNALRDALHNFTYCCCSWAGPSKGNACNNRRPADIYIPGWSAGRDAALDVCVTQPLHDRYRAQAAREPGYALTQVYQNKMRVTADLCDQQGIAFIPMAAESLGGWHKVANDEPTIDER